ncbi:MAG: tetratricopeptide repeat-containing sulfotransferase family protein [Rhizobiaceae bacterium]
MTTTKKEPLIRPLDSSTNVDLRALHKKLVEAESKRRAGKLVESEKICRELLNNHPTYVGALQTFGLVCLETENFRQAVTCFMTAAAEAPSDYTNFTNLGAAWLGLDVPSMAEIMLLEAKKINPDNPEIYQMIGDIAVADRRYEHAMSMYRKCLELKPDSKMAMFRLSECLVDHGFFGKAKNLLLKLHKLQPNWVAVLHLLRKLPHGMVDIDFERALENGKRQSSESEFEFANNCKFLQGAILDTRGKYTEAWKTLTTANEEIVNDHKEMHEKGRKQRDSNLLAIKKMSESEIQTISSSSRDECIPLFILGPSRAGKTTLEILSATHGAVKRGYENSMVEDAVVRAAQKAGLIKLHRLQLLPKPLLTSFVEEFRSRMTGYAGGAKCVTHTNPGLIGSVAGLAEALPEARFVFVSRNREDTAVRIFQQKYKSGNHHSYNLENTFEYVDWYELMFKELIPRLGNRIAHVQYEDMVADPHNTAEMVLNLCDLKLGNLELPDVGSDVNAAKPYADYLSLKA